MSESLLSITDENELRRRFLFRICETEQELHDWILTFLGIDLPNCTVYQTSDSNPMSMVWEMYSKMLDGTDESFMRVMYYAARDSFKTLGAAVVEILAILHCNRNVAHMAAIQEQALKAQEYVKTAFRRPHLRDFIIGDSERITKILRYYNPTTKHSLSLSEFTSLSTSEQAKHEEISRALVEYTEKGNYIKVVICSMSGANCIDPAISITMADGSKKMAMDVEVGDFVRGFDTKNRCFIDSRIAEKGLVVKPAVRIHFSGGGSVVVSDDHQVFTDSGWARAGSIDKGDWCFNASVDGNHPSSEEGTDLGAYSSDYWKPTDYKLLFSGRCIDCSCLLNSRMKGGFNRCDSCHKDDQDTKVRDRVFRASFFVNKVSKTEKLGLRTLLDLHIDTEDEARKNFIGNESVLLHNSEHVPLFCVDGKTEILCEGQKSTMTAVEIFNSLGEPNAYRVYEPKQKINLVCFNQKNGNKTSSAIVRAVRSKQKVFIVETTAGRKIRCTEDHPILTPTHGFLHVNQLNPGYELVVLGNSYPPLGRTEEHTEEDLYVEKWSESTAHFISTTERLIKENYLSVDTIKSIAPDGYDLVYNFTLASHYNYISNGLISHNCIDEVDIVANPKAYEEAQSIPAGRGGRLPITMLISTRKQAFGLVQKEIDRAAKSGLKIRNWNIIDVTQACPTSRHKPELPKVRLYVNQHELRHTDEAGFNELNFKEKEGFVETMGYAGCRNCKLYTACQGRLATEQHSTSLMLKSIPETIGKFNAHSIEMAKAQLLCLKPSSSGLIYSRFDKTKHVLSPAQAYLKVFGEPCPGEAKNYTKAQLLEAVRERDLPFYGGLDWGHTHNFAYVHTFKDGPRCFVTNCVSIPELDPDQMLDVCEPFRADEPTIYPDTADPKMSKLFKKHGYRMAKWNKGKGSVVGGIQIVRMCLNPPMGDHNLFFIHDIDEDVHMDILINNLAQYHWTNDSANNPTDIPSEEDDDEPDALRYIVMNVFAPSGGIVTTKTTLEDLGVPKMEETDSNSWMTKLIAEHTGETYRPGHSGMTIEVPSDSAYSYYSSDNKKAKKSEVSGDGKKGKKGGLAWDI